MRPSAVRPERAAARTVLSSVVEQKPADTKSTPDTASSPRISVRPAGGDVRPGTADRSALPPSTALSSPALGFGPRRGHLSPGGKVVAGHRPWRHCVRGRRAVTRDPRGVWGCAMRGSRAPDAYLFSVTRPPAISVAGCNIDLRRLAGERRVFDELYVVDAPPARYHVPLRKLRLDRPRAARGLRPALDARRTIGTPLDGVDPLARARGFAMWPGPAGPVPPHPAWRPPSAASFMDLRITRKTLAARRVSHSRITSSACPSSRFRGRRVVAPARSPGRASRPHGRTGRQARRGGGAS